MASSSSAPYHSLAAGGGEHLHYNRYVVWGIPFESEETARYARMVMVTAVLMVALAVVASIFSIASTFYFDLGIISSLILPCCGYLGAKRRSKPMMRFFVCCSAFESVAFIATFIATLAAMGDYLSCACDPGCRRAHGIDPGDAERIGARKALYSALYTMALSVGLAMAALQCAGAYYGSKLLQREEMDQAVAVPTGIPVDEASMATYPFQPQQQQQQPKQQQQPQQQQQQYQPAYSESPYHYNPQYVGEGGPSRTDPRVIAPQAPPSSVDASNPYLPPSAPPVQPPHNPYSYHCK